MRLARRSHVFYLALICGIACSATALAQAPGIAGGLTGEKAAEPKKPARPPELPADPSQWINCEPLTIKSLSGKAVFMWFYEEDCPTCRGKWPSMLSTAKKFEGKPVVFLAINSGNPREEVEQYAREVNLTWPVLVDSSREFEAACGQKEISLQNIYQAMVITADGKLNFGDWSDVEATVKKALAGAAWKVDPAEVPSSLQPAWLAIEFGNYVGVGPAVKKALASPKADVKEAAEKLAAAVHRELDPEISAAKTALDEGKKWRAYELYAQIGEQFKGFDLPTEVTDAKKHLAGDPQVKAGMLAVKNLEMARKLIATGKAPGVKRANGLLEKIVTDLPDTDVARRAQTLLGQK